MESHRSRHVDAGGLNIWIEEWGDAGGIPVFLCQRMGAQTFEWEPSLLAALVDARIPRDRARLPRVRLLRARAARPL